jgi:hypothetical protein
MRSTASWTRITCSSNLQGGRRGIPVSYPTVGKLVAQISARTGVDFTAHMSPGVFLVLAAKAPARVWQVHRSARGVITRLEKKREHVYHYSFHIMDPVFGHLVIKMSPSWDASPESGPPPTATTRPCASACKPCSSTSASRPASSRIDNILSIRECKLLGQAQAPHRPDAWLAVPALHRPTVGAPGGSSSPARTHSPEVFALAILAVLTSVLRGRAGPEGRLRRRDPGIGGRERR